MDLCLKVLPDADLDVAVKAAGAIGDSQTGSSRKRTDEVDDKF